LAASSLGCEVRPAPADAAVGALPLPRAVNARELLATVLVAAATCVLGALYLWRGVVPPEAGGQAGATTWLGVDQWAFARPAWSGLFAVAATGAGLGVARRPDACRRAAAICGRALDDRPVRLAIAAASTALFWLASTRRLNLDGSLLQQKFEEAVPRTGAFVTHDEMLELYLHSRLWAMLQTAWGWDVAHTYRATSCLAGGAAVLIALGLTRRFPPARRPLVVTGLFAGGWILVFFGDVENYTLTNLVVLAYLAAALRFLDDERARLWPVAAVLAVATLFHLQALVLGPSLLVLAHTAVRRGHRRDALAGVLGVPLILGAGLWWFDRHGLPIRDLVTRSQISAQGGGWAPFLAPADRRYLWQQLQLLLLLAPSVILLPALLVGGGRRREPLTAFLAVASAGALLLVFLWRAQLGPYGDWNLYALAAQPLGLLVLTRLARGPGLRDRAPWIAALLVLAATHTAAWIARNHTALP
jgi:hypothetical protein